MWSKERKRQARYEAQRHEAQRAMEGLNNSSAREMSHVKNSDSGALPPPPPLPPLLQPTKDKEKSQQVVSAASVGAGFMTGSFTTQKQTLPSSQQPLAVDQASVKNLKTEAMQPLPVGMAGTFMPQVSFQTGQNMMQSAGQSSTFGQACAPSTTYGQSGGFMPSTTTSFSTLGATDVSGQTYSQSNKPTLDSQNSHSSATLRRHAHRKTDNSVPNKGPKVSYEQLSPAPDGIRRSNIAVDSSKQLDSYKYQGHLGQNASSSATYVDSTTNSMGHDTQYFQGNHNFPTQW